MGTSKWGKIEISGRDVKTCFIFVNLLHFDIPNTSELIFRFGPSFLSDYFLICLFVL